MSSHFLQIYFTKEMKYSWISINVWEREEKWNSRAEGAGGGKRALQFSQPQGWNKVPATFLISVPQYIHLSFHPCIHSLPCYLLLCISTKESISISSYVQLLNWCVYLDLEVRVLLHELSCIVAVIINVVCVVFKKQPEVTLTLNKSGLKNYLT